jgi:tetratricopeptide (TPR) repeat protein
MTTTAAIKYRAFLSYSHRDKAWAKWLHAALEGYRIDKELVGRQTPVGPVPKTLRPIFRDREDFSAGHSLTDQTVAALEASQSLIVLCSPQAAQSHYVNEEIRRFKASAHRDQGRSAWVIPVIVAGEPGDPERECFPPALRYKVDANGELTPERDEPIAADARPEGDGKEIAKQKVIAGLLGLSLDEIARRAERARTRRHRFWAALAGAFLFLAVAASGSAVYAYQKVIESEARLDQAIEIAYGFVTEAVGMSDHFGVPSGLMLGLLRRAELALNGLIARGADSPMLRYRRAAMLLSFTGAYRALGKTNEAGERAAEARRLLMRSVSEDPQNLEKRLGLALSYWMLGEVLEVQRSLSTALDTLRGGLAIVEAIPADDPRSAAFRPEILRQLIGLRIDIGDALTTQGALSEGMKVYVECFDVVSRFAGGGSLQDEKYQNYLTLHPFLMQQFLTILRRLAQVTLYAGKLAESLAYFQQVLAVDEQRAANSDSVTLQFNLEDSLLAVGNGQLALGSLDEAMASFRKGLAIAERLVKTDPKNFHYERYVVGFKDAVGRVLLAQGQAREALAQFRANSSPLLASDVGNAIWQAYGALGHERIADALLALGDTAAAIEEYRKELAIIGPLAEANPIAEWEVYHAIAHFKLAEAMRQQAASAEAIEHFEASIAIARRLANDSPEIVGYQVLGLFARLRITQSEDDKTGKIETILGFLRGLRDERRLSFDQSKMLSDIEQEIAKGCDAKLQ